MRCCVPWKRSLLRRWLSFCSAVEVRRSSRSRSTTISLLDDLIATYRALVHSGAPIAEINTVRKHLSAVKGGRLAQAAFPAQQVSLLVSDVPDSTPDALASGPTMPDSTTVEDCYRIAEKYDLLRQFPASTRELFERHALDETPKSDDPAFHQSTLVARVVEPDRD